MYYFNHSAMLGSILFSPVLWRYSATIPNVFMVYAMGEFGGNSM
jgi:hypothetical protein